MTGHRHHAPVTSTGADDHPHPSHAVGDGDRRRRGRRRGCRRPQPPALRVPGVVHSRARRRGRRARRRRGRTPRSSGLELIGDGVASNLVVSRGSDRLCGTQHDFAVYCFVPDPDDTRGEAEAVGRIAAQEGWHHLVVVTSDYHATRAGLLFGRCFSGTVDVTAAHSDKSPLPLLWADRDRVGRPDRGRRPPRLLISPPPTPTAPAAWRRRRAGRTAARIPATPPAAATSSNRPAGAENTSRGRSPEKLRVSPQPDEHAHRDPAERTEAGDDHRLPPHGRPQLRPRETDRSQQAELTRSLPERQRQRVGDAHEGDEDREGEEHVDDREQRVDLRAHAVEVLRLVLHLRRELAPGDARRPRCGPARSTPRRPA